MSDKSNPQSALNPLDLTKYIRPEMAEFMNRELLIQDRERMLQIIAEICGQYSMHCVSGTYVMYTPDLEPMEIPPERVEGIYQEIYRRLSADPAYEPIKRLEFEVNKISSWYVEQKNRADKLHNELSRVMIRNYVCLLCGEQVRPAYAGNFKHKIDCALYVE